MKEDSPIIKKLNEIELYAVTAALKEANEAQAKFAKFIVMVGLDPRVNYNIAEDGTVTLQEANVVQMRLAETNGEEEEDGD